MDAIGKELLDAGIPDQLAEQWTQTHDVEVTCQGFRVVSLARRDARFSGAGGIT